MQRQTVKRRGRNFVWGALLFLTAFFVGAARPAYAIDPVTAGIASGIAVELVKGIATSLKGDDVAQVQVRVKTYGPDGDDRAFDGQTDKDDWWPEYYLDVKVRAEADRVEHHFASGELHYAYTKGKGWRPNNVAFITGQEWWGAAVAYPDSTPEKDSDNKTEAAVVGAFSWNGVTEFNGYLDQSKKVVEVPHSPKVQATNAVLLNFDSSQFAMTSDPLDVNHVIVAPRDTSLGTVDLFHNYAGYASDDFFYSGITNFNATSQPLVDDIASDIATQAGLTAASDTQRAELTFGSAAITFAPVSLDRYKVVGSDLVEKTPNELLADYLSQLWIGPTAQSQLGYSPTVLSRTVLFSGATLPTGGLEVELADRLAGTFDGEVGLFFYVDSYLEDAVNLAANTPGSALASYFASLNAGDTFTIDLAFGTGESFIRTDQNKAMVPEPASAALLVTGIGCIVASRRKKK